MKRKLTTQKGKDFWELVDRLAKNAAHLTPDEVKSIGDNWDDTEWDLPMHDIEPNERG